jgi:hypothetical protein
MENMTILELGVRNGRGDYETTGILPDIIQGPAM